MFAHCGNNPVNNVDPYGECYFAADGTWRHDNWEYLGEYIRKPKPEAVDVTQKMNEEMANNATLLKQHRQEQGYISAILFFVKQVAPGGNWDFKAQEKWSLDPNVVYLYNGKQLRFDDIGNIHYGYVGRALFETNTLLMAGGIIQIFTGTSDVSYWNSNFDDPRDQWAIRFGGILWDRGDIP